MSRQAVLAVLERAASDTSFLAKLADRPSEAIEGYELDSREAAVLASGDIGVLEEWFGKLDERLLTWPKCRLQQEKWCFALCGLPVNTEVKTKSTGAIRRRRIVRKRKGV